MPGKLLVVGTPLGNLGDFPPRAVEALQSASLILCEDTRHTRKLLTHFGIDRPSDRLDEHTEDARSAQFIDRIEAGEGFTKLRRTPREYVALAGSFGLTVQMELGDKHAGAFTPAIVQELIATGSTWLDAGAKQIVVEARESAQTVGLFDDSGRLNFDAAEAFAGAFGMDRTIFEAPNKRSQFDFLTHFGNTVNLSNVRIEEVLRVEIYRRGLHSDAYARELAPRSTA